MSDRIDPVIRDQVRAMIADVRPEAVVVATQDERARIQMDMLVRTLAAGHAVLAAGGYVPSAHQIDRIICAVLPESDPTRVSDAQMLADMQAADRGERWRR